MLLHGANHLSTSLTLLISKKPGSRMNPTIQIPLWAQPQKQIKSCNPFSKRTQAGFVFQFFPYTTHDLPKSNLTITQVKITKKQP